MQVRSRELFTTVRTEGALLPPELLQRVADGDPTLPGLAPADYHLLPGETFGEAINRSWSRLTGAWAAYRAALEREPRAEPATTPTRERWLLPLLSELGFGRLPAARAVEIDGRSYPVSHAWMNTPLHLVGAGIELDQRTAGVAGAARQSPHSLVQELLNASDERLWGVVSNGLRLRLLRDNAQMARQAYVEFDLEGMMEGEVYSDFALLWLVCHQSRFEAEQPEQSWLERWSRDAAERGTRARESLRQGVEAAIGSLGRGFLAHRDSRDLRTALRLGRLSAHDYYRQLLRLVYRLLFLFVAEDRGVLLDPRADEAAKERYAAYYSTRRLRRLAERRRGGPHPDLWHALGVVMRSLGDDEGSPGLALPALGSLLWSDEAMPDLAGAVIANRDLLAAVRELAFVEQDRALRPVDFRNLGAEELGSVYESLLELHPRLDVDAPSFALEAAAGSERKTTGSYYTPTSLIVELLDSALDPVLDRAAAADDPEAAILDLTVCDPACGSGHFLIAAAQRIAKRLASIRTGDAEPAPEPVRAALRDVVGRCIYGVDVNEMAVELCKVSLWMDALEPGRPLSFLDHRIVLGNSLLGATPALVARGVPDAAFTPLLGDDRATVTALRKRNARERGGQLALAVPVASGTAPLAEALSRLEDTPDEDIAGVHERERRFRDLLSSDAHARARWAANAWCAAFVAPKRPGEPTITTDTVRGLATDPTSVPRAVRERVAEIARAHRLLHWHVAFPDVFRVDSASECTVDGAGWTGGFDCVLGNPPWDQIEADPKRFFAATAPNIAEAPSAQQPDLISGLQATDPAQFRAWTAFSESTEASRALLQRSGVFPRSAGGRLNTSALFTELCLRLLSSTGRAALIVPTALVLNKLSSPLLEAMLSERRLSSLFDFENRHRLFPDVHSSQRFCLLTLSGAPSRFPARVGFRFHSTSELKANSDRCYELDTAVVARLSPETMTLPVFTTGRAARLTTKVYEMWPTLAESDWRFRGFLMFMMDEASRIAVDPANFSEAQRAYLFPLYEGKMISAFDHRAASVRKSASARIRTAQTQATDLAEHGDPFFRVIPRWWLTDEQVRVRVGSRWSHSWFVAWKDVTSVTNERTMIAAMLPWSAVGASAPVALIEASGTEALAFVALLNAFVFDFVCRTRVGGTHLTFHIVNQLPTLTRKALGDPAPWLSTESAASWTASRAFELSYTAWDLRPLAEELGHARAPFRWYEKRRQMIRAELDAAHFHLYGLSRGEVEYVMETFPIVRRKDEAAYGEYQTKNSILSVYDAMAEAIRTGRAYETILDPPPAHDSLRHPPPHDEVGVRRDRGSIR